MRYIASVDGCDDSTHVEIEEMSPALLAFAKLVNDASECVCQPSIHIYQVSDDAPNGTVELT